MLPQVPVHLGAALRARARRPPQHRQKQPVPPVLVHALAADGIAEDALHVGEPRLGARARDAVYAAVLLDAEDGVRAARVVVVRAAAGAEYPLAEHAVRISGEPRGVVLRGGDGMVPELERRPAASMSTGMTAWDGPWRW